MVTMGRPLTPYDIISTQQNPFVVNNGDRASQTNGEHLTGGRGGASAARDVVNRKKHCSSGLYT